MRFVSGRRFVLAAVSLALILTAYGGSPHAASGAGAVAKVKATVLPHWYLTRSAGFFPPVGARATLPAHGTTLLELPRGNLYADGHIITDRGVQRLTPWGSRLLWSKIRTIGMGKKEPVVQCDQKNMKALIECLQPNRRVDVEVRGTTSK